MPRLDVTQSGHRDRLHYFDIGPKDAPAMVLLHGFGMQGAAWIPFVLPLSKRNRFLLLDMRGFGGSSRIPLREPDLLKQHAMDVRALVTSLRLEKPALGGLSMGAATSLQYLRDYGFEDLRAYVHIDQAPRILNGDDWAHGLFGADQAERFREWDDLWGQFDAYPADAPFSSIAEPLQNALSANLVSFFDYGFHHPGLRRLMKLVKYEPVANLVLDRKNWKLYLDAVKSYRTRGYDFREDLRRVQIPMSIFVGAKSRMYPPAGQEDMQRYVPHAKIVSFEKAGHALPFEEPIKFTRELGKFLRESH